MKDQNLTVKKAGSTVAETAYSTALDTRAPSGVGNVTGPAKLYLNIEAAVGLSDTKTQTYTIQDSADNSTFADVPGYPSIVVTGAGGTGGPATEKFFEWISSLRRYVRVKCVTVSTPGTITAFNYFFGVELGSRPGQ